MGLKKQASLSGTLTIHVEVPASAASPTVREMSSTVESQTVESCAKRAVGRVGLQPVDTARRYTIEIRLTLQSG
jgi:hypothetical protein